MNDQLRTALRSGIVLLASTVSPVAVSLLLPRLPIDLDSTTNEADPALQCVDVGWIVTKTDNPDIPPGHAAQVTGVTCSDKGSEAVTGACEAAAPACVGRIVRTGSTRCSLAVRALPDADPEVTVQVGSRRNRILPQRCWGSTGALNVASPTLPLVVDGEHRLQFVAP